MELCSRGHEEVCYEGRTCPFCEYIEETNAEIANLKAEIAEWEKGE